MKETTKEWVSIIGAVLLLPVAYFVFYFFSWLSYKYIIFFLVVWGALVWFDYNFNPSSSQWVIADLFQKLRNKFR